MKIIELDLTGCKYLSEIHQRIRDAFNFPQWYGKNWSAFGDLLWSDCDANKVIIKGESSLPDEIKDSLEKMYEILERNKKLCEKDERSFDYEIIN